MRMESMTEEVKLCIEERRFGALRSLLAAEEPADIAELLEEVPRERLMMLYRILPKALAAEVFAEMGAEAQRLLVESFSDHELKQVLADMYTDDTVDMIEEMPAGVARRILAMAPAELRRDVNELLKYPEDSAGSIMTTEYVALKRDMTVEAALAYIRRVAPDKETIYTCYVIDRNRRLVGMVTARALLLASPDTVLEQLMEQNVISAVTSDNGEQVAYLLDRYHFLALPVVDGEGRLVGIITVDDAMSIIHRETEEDFAKMAAMAPPEKAYMKTGVFALWRNRFPWLLILMLSATFTGWIISAFEGALAASVALTAFIPMLMGTGGNSGSQASVTVIRALSVGEVEFADWLRVLWRELRVALLCGVTLGVAAFGKLQLVDRLLMGNEEVTLTVSLVVAVTLALTVVIAKVAGGLLPILTKRLGFDPAVMASPFITTLVDALSLLIYFTVAQAMLPI